jgi:alcohol dehydrogenase (cytochrome c)
MVTRLTASPAVVLALAAFTCVAFRPPTAAASPINGRTVPDTDWPAYNNDPGSNRYSPLNQIQKGNVGTLHPICSATLDNPVGFETGPVVVGGVLYATTLDNTYAIDATTCKILWTNHYPVNIGLANRGVAYAAGMVFRGFWDGHVVAINATTGATVWQVSLTNGDPSQFLSAAPITWRGALIMGTAGADTGGKGQVFALAQATGKILWRHQLVPDIGDMFSYTWKGAQHIAGGSTWSSFTLNDAAGTLWVSTGNPGPDYNDSQRIGANLWSSSVVALNASTGNWLQGYQLIPQDFHDWDVAATPAFVKQAAGPTLVVAAAKDGVVRAIDPKLGRIAWSTPVTRRYNVTAPMTILGTRFCPGTRGGTEWNGPSYSQLSGAFYVNSVDWCTTITLAPTFPPYAPPAAWEGGIDIRDPNGFGRVTALDAKTGAVRWWDKMPTPMVAGVTSTAGGLVFTADLSGTIYALDADTGATLGAVATQLPVGGGVVTYATHGTQYVAVAAGMTSWIWSSTAAAPQIVVLGL